MLRLSECIILMNMTRGTFQWLLKVWCIFVKIVTDEHEQWNLFWGVTDLVCLWECTFTDEYNQQKIFVGVLDLVCCWG